MSTGHARNVEWLDNAPFREAFLASGLTANMVAKNGGMGRGGGSWVQRALGLKDHDGKIRDRVRYETAVKIVCGMDRDPVDFGV